MIWALSIGVLPTHQVYSRIPTVDWRFFLRHEHATAIALDRAARRRRLIAFLWARRRVEDFRDTCALGFAILARPPPLLLGVLVPQAISWVFRIASLYFFLRGVRRARDVHNALLAQVVDSLATLFPATPGGAGTKQGLIVFLFRGQAISKTLLLAFSVGMNIAIVVVNLVIGLARDRADGAARCRSRSCAQRSRAEQEQTGLGAATRRSIRS